MEIGDIDIKGKIVYHWQYGWAAWALGEGKGIGGVEEAGKQLDYYAGNIAYCRRM